MFSSYAQPSTIIIIRGEVEDSRGQGQGQPFRGQTLSRPKTEMLEAQDTGASVLKKKSGLQKKVSSDLKNKATKKFSDKLQKKVFKKFIQAIYKIFTIQKLCCPRAEDRAIFEDLRLRGQGLQNVSLRTAPLMIIPSVEIRQENLSIDRKTNISGNFEEMAGDSRLCGDFVQLW